MLFDDLDGVWCFVGGVYFIMYLFLCDYYCVYVFVLGWIVGWWYVLGILLFVGVCSVVCELGLFMCNEWFVIWIEGEVGLCVVVMVVVVGVGNIIVVYDFDVEIYGWLFVCVVVW